MVGILFTKLRRDINRGKKQFIAVVVTVFLGVFLFGASFDAYQNMVASYDQMFEDLSFSDMTISGGDTTAILEGSQSISGIAASDSRIVADIPFQMDDGHRLVGRLIGMPPDEQPAVNQVDVLEGDYLSSGQPDGVLVERSMADNFDLEPGDTLSILHVSDAGKTGGENWQQVTVVGIVSSAEYLWPARSRQDIFPNPDEFGVLFAAEELTGTLACQTGVSQALFRYDQDADALALDTELTALADQNDAIAVVRGEEQPSNELLRSDIEGLRELAFLFPLLFLGAAGMATYMLMTRIVQSQRAEIGMMVASGVEPRPILTHYITYGVLVGLLGAIPGAIAGIFGAMLFTDLYVSALSIPTTVNEVHLITPLLGILFGLIMGVLATLAPALGAVRTLPAEAMRGPSISGTGNLSLVERLIPPLRRLPTRWKMVVRGVGRSPRRSISTIIGVVLALTLVLVSWGMIDTIQLMLDRQFNDIQHQDATVIYADPVGEEQVIALQDIDGVSRAEPVIQTPVSISTDDESYETVLLALEPETEMHTFITTIGDNADLPDNGMLAGQALASQLDIAVGDEVEVSIPSLNISFTTQIDNFLDEPLGTNAYISLPYLSQEINGQTDAVTPVNSAMVQFAPDAGADAVVEELRAQPGVVSVQDAAFLKNRLQDFMALFYIFVGIMLVLGGLMAFALIYNMMTINVSERSVEIATMQASGVRQRGISEMLVSENLLLVVIGIIPGLIVGYLAAWGFLASFSSDLLKFEVEIRPTTLLLSALAMIFVALISLWPSLRSVRRINLGQVMRERAT